tara:strand:- start:85 stop:642 length:558 start_codon:yes stop_codon:yes gene_type:complete
MKNIAWVYIGGPLLIILSIFITMSREQTDFTKDNQKSELTKQRSNQASKKVAEDPRNQSGEKAKEDASANWRLLQKLDYESGKMPKELKSLVNKKIKIPGYAVPLENSFRSIKEFLLVPNQLACIHVPPPPPNLMINIRPREPVTMEQLYGPIWIIGKLKLETVKSEYGPASWKITNAIVEPYVF